MRRWVALVGALATVAPLMLGATAAPARAAAAPTGPADAGQVAGAAVPDVPPSQLPAELSRMRRDGINTVSVFVWWLSPGRTSARLSPYSGTLSDDAVRAEVAAAVRGGMRVSLTPLFYCSTCEGGWRGTMAPADPSAFFSSYRAFIDHYAALAQATGVSTFFVGSEMTSLEQDTAEWDQVIAGARRLFRGRLAYEENWDVLGRARFLTRVDVIGVSAYFPLDDSPAPTLAELRSDWSSSRASAAPGRNWVAELARLAAATGRPILFGEAGYMSGDYAAKQPFLNFGGQADWQLQADLYQALLGTFSAQPWWDGVVWWEWFATPDNSYDNSRSPRGKAAETLLARWYAGARPAGADVPLVVAGPPGSRVASQGAGRPVAVAGPAAAAAAARVRTGLDPIQRSVLWGLVALLVAVALACWATLGRRPAP